LLLFDVNVLVYAHRSDSVDHERYRDWLQATMSGSSSYGMADMVLSGFLRVVTHPKVFREPSPLDKAMAFVEEVRAHPNCVTIAPGQRHWDVFTQLCLETGARGNLIADAYLAALAIESGSEWITTDRDYARFPDLRWRHPLAPDRTR
jgi:uncharacterized protein